MKRRISVLSLTLLIWFSCPNEMRSQDIHFTQFFATPLFTNPALTGHFDGTYRFSGVIRQQWISVSPQPFRTFGGGIDLNAPLGLKPIGAGIHLAQDQTGLSNLTTTQFSLFISGRIRFGSRLSLRLGGSAGGFQQVIDYSSLSFGEQFNGITYDPNIAPTDITGRQANLFQWNYNGGGFIEYKIDNRRYIGGGYALYNITEPNRSFNAAYENPLPQRHSLHVFSTFKVLNNWDLMPAIQYMRQGEQDALLLGSAIRYHMNTGPVQPQSIQLGIWGRTGDAANISAGFQNGNLYLGAAYDVNLSTLQPASRYRGGWEIAVIYTLSTVRENVKRLRQCPDYL